MTVEPFKCARSRFNSQQVHPTLKTEEKTLQLAVTCENTRCYPSNDIKLYFSVFSSALTELKQH